MWNEKRRSNARIYNEAFDVAGIKRPVDPAGLKHIYHQYTIEIDKREKVVSDLAQDAITAFVYYPNPVHIQHAYKELGYKEGDLPVAENIGKRMLSIPVHPMMSEDDASKVAQAVIDSLKS
jgi:dTDP-4-amino-4,6-dideoxygalactose transaminase